jgi:hypothetical protein
MKKILWGLDKAKALQGDGLRGNVGFEECVLAIENGRILADIANPSEKYPHQRMMVLNINNYAFVAPYIESEDEIFLKTVYPSRKHTAIYLVKGEDE